MEEVLAALAAVVATAASITSFRLNRLLWQRERAGTQEREAAESATEEPPAAEPAGESTGGEEAPREEEPAAARSGPGPRDRRFAAATTALLALLALGLTLGFLVVVGGEDEDRDPFPNAGETTLMNVLPPELRPTCKRLSVAREPEAVVGVRCNPTGKVSTASFVLYASKKAMDRRFERRRRETGVPEGDCLVRESAWGEYTQGNLATTGGRRLCYRERDVAGIEWTDVDLNIYSSGQSAAADADALEEWWTRAGPTPTFNRRPFPDGREEDLIALLARRVRSDCRRNPFEVAGLRASINCRTGKRSLSYLTFDSQASLTKYFRGRIADVGRSPGSCARRGHEPIQRRYRVGGEIVGRRLCYEQHEDGKVARVKVEWTDNRFFAYGVATVKGDALYDLFAWWRRTRGSNL